MAAHGKKQSLDSMRAPASLLSNLAAIQRPAASHDLADDQKVCPCCSERLHRMGEVVTEQLHIEVKATVLQNARAKYACRNCDRTGVATPIVLAPMPAQPSPGSIATASTLAFALVHKYGWQARDEIPDEGETQASYMRRFRQNIASRS